MKMNEVDMSGLRESYDAIIIGAGVGGGAMANQLAAAGARVLVIERGTRLPREIRTGASGGLPREALRHEETWRDRDGQEFNPSTYY